LPSDLSTPSDLQQVVGWTPSHADSLYHLASWGDGYFGVNGEGHVAVRPVRGADTSIDLFDVVRDLRERGIGFPALIRFQDILKSRVQHLNEAFIEAIEKSGYGATYQGVYPIKVNQLREVLEEILAAGEPYGHGLECGSKSELVATLPYLADRDVLLLCNGSKDREMVRLMLAGQRLGKRVFPILERSDEIGLLEGEARGLGVEAEIGVRVRLTTRGAGLWSESGGEHSKFGLSLTEIIELVDSIRAGQLPVRLRLVHFHLGSQIADLGTLTQAVEEATRVYAWLRARGIDVDYLDVGGGLGVAYEAGNQRALSAINYELADYAQAVVSTVKRVCDEEGAPHPTLVSESGRAVTAHHSVLVVQAVGNRRKVARRVEALPEEAHHILRELFSLQGQLDAATGPSTPQDLDRLLTHARELRSEMAGAFRRGTLSVEDKALFEQLYWAFGMEIDRRAQVADPMQRTRALDALASELVDHYHCNFSVFRSMVDYWAIGQRFPIVPIHRLDEPPTRRGILVDLTCDSDGKVDKFVSETGDKRHLELHDVRPDEPYYLGLFLMGAYQDIMGDMHNLFGRVTEVHVFADENEPGSYYIEEILTGATVEEQLALVQYHANDLDRRMGDLIRQQVSAGRLRPNEGVKLLNEYRRMFRSMTYLATETDRVSTNVQ